MKQYLGNYLGLVIDNNDPEFRGRVQVFVPHILPTLYQDWNQKKENITLKCVGNNLPQGLSDNIINKLKKILPWAEAASPIVGQSSPGNLVSAANNISSAANPSPIGGSPSDAGGGASSFNQSPTSIPQGNPPPGIKCIIPLTNNGVFFNGVKPKFIDRLNNWYNDVSSRGFKVTCSSAFRSTEHQTRLWNNSRKDGSVAYPGTSYHEAGIAVDLIITGPGVSITSLKVPDSRSGKNYDNAEFKQTLQKYGLHQPLHPDTGTGTPEHWHIEPIETPKAQARLGSDARTRVAALMESGAAAGGETTSSSAFPAKPNPLSSKNSTGADVGSGASPITNAPPVNVAPNKSAGGGDTAADCPICNAAKENIGYRTDADLRRQGADGNVGCAYSVTKMLKQAGLAGGQGQIKGSISTTELNQQLASNPGWRQVPISQAGPGMVIVSPTIRDSSGKVIGQGHTAVIGEGRQIVGNLSKGANSQIGKDGRTPETWQQQMTGRGVQTYVYAPVGPGAPSGASSTSSAGAGQAAANTGSEGASSAGASPSTSSNLGQTTSSNILAKDRSARFGPELSNPKVLGRIEKICFDQEYKGSNPLPASLIFETVVNRAYFQGATLEKTLFHPGYLGMHSQSINSSTPKTEEIVRRVIYNGQNLTGMATDNASNEPGNQVAKGRCLAKCTGSWWDLSNGSVISDPNQIAALVTGNSSTKEFLYIADGQNGKCANHGIKAKRYAQAHNISIAASPDGSFKADAPLPEGLGKAVASDLTNSPTGSMPNSNTVNTVDSNGPTVIKNTNDSPKGMFTFPGVGAMVWVFFREGNPLFPVYFAASYSADEWKAAYGGRSLDPLGLNNGSVGNQISNSLKLNPNAGGGMEFTHIKDTSDPSGASDKATTMIYGDDGSNFLLSKGYTQFYARHDRRDQIDGNHFHINHGTEEKWVQGDASSNTQGNVFVKIGRVDSGAMEIVKQLSDYSASLNKDLLS